MQWELALEMYERQDCERKEKNNHAPQIKILPIMLGDTDQTKFHIDFTRFSQERPFHRSTLNKYSVQQIVQGIFEFQGRETSPGTIKE